MDPKKANPNTTLVANLGNWGIYERPSPSGGGFSVVFLVNPDPKNDDSAMICPKYDLQPVQCPFLNRFEYKLPIWNRFA